MAISFSAKMVHNGEEFIGPLRVFHLAVDLYLGLDLNEISNFIVVHLLLVEVESLEVNY